MLRIITVKHFGTLELFFIDVFKSFNSSMSAYNVNYFFV